MAITATILMNATWTFTDVILLPLAPIRTAHTNAIVSEATKGMASIAWSKMNATWDITLAMNTPPVRTLKKAMASNANVLRDIWAMGSLAMM